MPLLEVSASVRRSAEFFSVASALDFGLIRREICRVGLDRSRPI
jgi:hypothetical protein